MNLHKFFHGDEIFFCPCVLDSGDGILRRITNVPSNDTISTRAMGVSIPSDLATFPKPKLGDDNDRMPAARRAWRQTAVCPYRRMFDVHFFPFHSNGRNPSSAISFFSCSILSTTPSIHSIFVQTESSPRYPQGRSSIMHIWELSISSAYLHIASSFTRK